MTLGFRILAIALIALALGCTLTTRQAETVALEGANAAIVSAARDIDAREAAEEKACAGAPACIAAARARWNAVLEAYDGYRIAWALLVARWNSDAPDADIDTATAAVRAAEAAFYAARGKAVNP